MPATPRILHVPRFHQSHPHGCGKPQTQHVPSDVSDPASIEGAVESLWVDMDLLSDSADALWSFTKLCHRQLWPIDLSLRVHEVFVAPHDRLRSGPDHGGC